jgi:hypothetical protein
LWNAAEQQAKQGVSELSVATRGSLLERLEALTTQKKFATARIHSERDFQTVASEILEISAEVNDDTLLLIVDGVTAQEARRFPEALARAGHVCIFGQGESFDQDSPKAMLADLPEPLTEEDRFVFALTPCFALGVAFCHENRPASSRRHAAMGNWLGVRSQVRAAATTLLQLSESTSDVALPGGGPVPIPNGILNARSASSPSSRPDRPREWRGPLSIGTIWPRYSRS